VVITSELPTSFHESQCDRWSSRMRTIVRWLLLVFTESYRLLRVNQGKELVAVRV